MISDEQINRLADRALQMAKAIQGQGDFDFLLSTYHEARGMRRELAIEGHLRRELGGRWMNSPELRQRGLDILADAFLPPAPDAVVIAALMGDGQIHVLVEAVARHVIINAEGEIILDLNWDGCG